MRGLALLYVGHSMVRGPSSAALARHVHCFSRYEMVCHIYLGCLKEHGSAEPETEALIDTRCHPECEEA
jgi:hypothetical protein